MSTEEYRGFPEGEDSLRNVFFRTGNDLHAGIPVPDDVLHGLRVPAHAGHIRYHVRGKNLGRYQRHPVRADYGQGAISRAGNGSSALASKVAVVSIPISTVLLFSIEGVENMGLRIAAAILTYVIWDLCYTVSDAPAYALAHGHDRQRQGPIYLYDLCRASGERRPWRSRPSSYRCSLTPQGFFAAGIVAAVLCFIFMSFVLVFCKERFYVKDS